MKQDSEKEESSQLNRDLSRHNMWYGILHGAFFHAATAFADPYVVLPLFLAGFTDSRAIIGFVVSLIQAMSVLPQIAMARLIRRRPGSARPLMLVGIWTRCGVWGLIAAGALLMPKESIWILIVFIFFVSVYSLGGGIAVLPFKHVISTTIPAEFRSTLFGWRLLSGGSLAVLAGLVVKYILGSDTLTWPRNYGALFALSFVSLAVAYTAMSQFRFLKNRGQTHLAELPPLFQELVHVRRHYPISLRLIGVRLLCGGLPLVLPFLTLYATREVGVPLAWVGVYIAVQKAAMILSNFAWMPLGNRCGTRAVILPGLALALASLGVIFFSTSAFSIAIAFGFAGAGMSAMLVGFNGYILEIGTPEIKPLLFALEGTLLMPVYFMPLLGGWLADAWGYRAVVVVGCVLLIGALGAGFTLCEPRKGDAACGPREPDLA
ncbi:MAG: MFS transporter [Candidatus Pacebacteria bacterium]|nr:MFS transporter [Candidatus Paceibacterota bacterium]